MRIFEKIYRHGLHGTMRKVVGKLMNKSGYTKWKFRNHPVYANPTVSELTKIESDMAAIGIILNDYAPPPKNSMRLKSKPGFLLIITVA